MAEGIKRGYILKILFNGISQEDYDYAVECLEVCKQDEARDYGFNYPFFAPGGIVWNRCQNLN